MVVRFGVVSVDGAARFALVDGDRALFERSPRVLPAEMDEALTLEMADLRRALESAAESSDLEEVTLGPAATLLAPLGREQEVWAAGVTYKRSLDARTAESSRRTAYDLVYEAERPELFFKAPARRVVGPGEAVGIRSDSSWNVPEPELTLAVNACGEIVGYTLGNDMSSRSIEGANPLYLPQAKTYERSCAIGPAVVPAWEVPRPEDITIAMSILRRGEAVFRAEISVEAMRRPLAELVSYLTRALEFPHGMFLLTGTGIVPPDDFTLEPADEVRISSPMIGELANTVVTV